MQFSLFDVIFSRMSIILGNFIGKSLTCVYYFEVYLKFHIHTSAAKREISSEKLSAEQTSAVPADESRGFAVASSHFWKINRSRGNNGWLKQLLVGNKQRQYPYWIMEIQLPKILIWTRV